MKKLALVLSLFLAVCIFSCEKPNLGLDTQNTLNQLQPIAPDGIPQEVFTYVQADFEKIMNKKLANYRLENELLYSLGKTRVLYLKIQMKYPNISNFTEVEIPKARKYFPNNTDAEIWANAETVKDHIEKLISYEMSFYVDRTLIPRENTAMLVGDDLTSCERNFLYAHPRMIPGVEYARTNSIRITEDKFKPTDKLGNVQNNGDAFRHGMLTALIAKHGGRSYSDIDKVVNLVIQFTDLHENCAPPSVAQIDKDMDKHNNRVGANYFRSVAYRVKVSCFLSICNYNVNAPDDNTIAERLFWDHIQKYEKKATSADIKTTDANTFVFLRGWDEPLVK